MDTPRVAVGIVRYIFRDRCTCADETVVARRDSAYHRSISTDGHTPLDQRFLVFIPAIRITARVDYLRERHGRAQFVSMMTTLFWRSLDENLSHVH